MSRLKRALLSHPNRAGERAGVHAAQPRVPDKHKHLPLPACFSAFVSPKPHTALRFPNVQGDQKKKKKAPRVDGTVSSVSDRKTQPLARYPPLGSCSAREPALLSARDKPATHELLNMLMSCCIFMTSQEGSWTARATKSSQVYFYRPFSFT